MCWREVHVATSIEPLAHIHKNCAAHACSHMTCHKLHHKALDMTKQVIIFRVDPEVQKWNVRMTQ